MCGKEAELVQAIVEGTMLSVCSNCAKYGNVIEVRKPEIKKERKAIVKEELEIIEIVVKDYAEKIKKAREAKELTQEKLAKAIAEKESVIQNLESAQLRPSLKLARKLEQFLHVKLIDTHKEEASKKKFDLKDKSLTIGDLLKIKKPR